MNNFCSLFKLKKIYSDLIDDAGNCFIVYHAELKFFFVRFYYGALIFSDFENVVKENHTYKKTNYEIRADEFYFKNKSLGIVGKWRSTDEEILIHLYEDPVHQE